MVSITNRFSIGSSITCIARSTRSFNTFKSIETRRSMGHQRWSSINSTVSLSIQMSNQCREHSRVHQQPWTPRKTTNQPAPMTVNRATHRLAFVVSWPCSFSEISFFSILDGTSIFFVRTSKITSPISRTRLAVDRLFSIPMPISSRHENEAISPGKCWSNIVFVQKLANRFTWKWIITFSNRSEIHSPMLLPMSIRVPSTSPVWLTRPWWWTVSSNRFSNDVISTVGEQSLRNIWNIASVGKCFRVCSIIRSLFHWLDGVLQMKNNYTTFLSLCMTLSRYYQVDGDPLMEENSAIIQRMFVHGFACCVRRNAKIELDYLIKNHALIYYDSCRMKPSDIQHNILTYCVVRNLATIFDQLMSNMKTMMYRTYQNSTNPDWQPHIAWREIIHVIIDPVSQQGNGSHDHNDFTQLACYGDLATNYNSNGSIQILHTTGDEYNRCNNARNNLILKAKRKLPRALSDANKQRPRLRRMNSLNQQSTKEPVEDESVSDHGIHRLGSASSQVGRNVSLTKKSKQLLKNVNPLRWGGKYERQRSNGSANEQQTKKRPSVPVANFEQGDLSQALDAISLVSDTVPLALSRCVHLVLSDDKHLLSNIDLCPKDVLQSTSANDAFHFSCWLRDSLIDLKIAFLLEGTPLYAFLNLLNETVSRNRLTHS